MRPRFTANDERNHCVAHTEPKSNFLVQHAARTKTPNVSYHCLSQLCSPMSFATRRPRTWLRWLARRMVLPSTTDHICDVILMGSRSQVRRITARTIVARVQNVQVRRNISMRQHVGDTVCAKTLSVNGVAPVTRTHEIAFPRPTSVGTAALINLVPEAINLVPSPPCNSARSRATTLLARSGESEGDAALGTHVCGRIRAHDDLRRCATPPAVTSSAGASMCQLYH